MKAETELGGGGRPGFLLLIHKASPSVAVFSRDPPPWRRADPSVHTPTSPLSFPPVRPTLQFYLPPVWNYLLLKYLGRLSFSDWILIQRWLDVLIYTRIFYLPFSLWPPPFKDYRTGLCFFVLMFVEKYFSTLNTFVKHGGYFINHFILQSILFYTASLNSCACETSIERDSLRLHWHFKN